MKNIGEARPVCSGDVAHGAGLLHDLFAHAAALWPYRIAIDLPPGRQRPERRQLSYTMLDQASNALAAQLRPLVQRECIVAIDLPRGPELYIAQLAVLKAGAAYTCLDPAFPAARKQEILDDAEAVALLSRDAANGIAVQDLQCVTPIADSGWRPTPESLAYVIYTSGTTGRPKGVMIEHRSIHNLVAGDLAAFDLSPADRVVQGSSAAYDSAIEESWLAFAAGATLLVMDDDTARLGPDLVGWLRDECATVFCPPPTLLRSTGCVDPAAALPDLKLLYVGGEALPREIADRWAQGRTMVNGYGPTECTVTCLRGEIRPGEPVTIGRPVDGAQAWVLGEDMEELPVGAAGELHIGGAGLARGYWKAPEQTAAKFVDHVRLGRVYRTGDLVQRDAQGDFFYHGRIDSQVKIRGYRIELGEIEARLEACDGVRAAAATVQPQEGAPVLVAWIVPDDAGHPPTPDALRDALAATLPGYMVPRRIGVLAALPTSVGGKLNRANLPAMPLDSVEAASPGARPESELERLIEAAFADILQRPSGVSIHDDFFEDLGGDSLRAAVLVSLLRQDEATAWINVSDIYEARTVAALAECAPAISAVGHETGIAPADLFAGQHPLLVTIMQLLWLTALLYAASIGGWLISFELLPRLTAQLGLIPFILLSPVFSLVAFLLYLPCSAVLAVAVKRVLIGRYTARREPVWGRFYWRHWIVQQTAKLIPWRVIEGTLAQQAILRALGARIGKRVHIHRNVDLRRGGWDLLDIGDDVTLNHQAVLRLVDLDSGHLEIGPIALGAGATLDTRAGVAGHCVVEPGAQLTALSALAPGSRIPAGELWDGVPAKCIGRVPVVPNLDGRAGQALSPAAYGLALVLAEAVIAMIVALPLEAVMILACRGFGVDAEGLWRWMYAPTADPKLWAILLGLTAITVPLTLAWSAIVARSLGRVRPGVISRTSLAYVRVWLKTGMLNAASEWLSGTLFWPHWLRLAGMRIGRNSEISTIIDVVPELVGIGSETFFADGIYLGGPLIRHGTVSLAFTSLGDRSFLGNHVVIRSGQQLPNDILIGISTPADATRIRPGTAWFGHPSFELPRREVVAMDRQLTHEPGALRYTSRVFWEGLRFALPIGPLLTSIAWLQILTRGGMHFSRLVFLLAVAPLATLAASVALCGTILAMKWGLLGRVRPGQHALWSCWCSRWDFLYVAWGKYARPILELLEGTLMLLIYLRAIGMKLGKRVVLGPGFSQVVDPDMITIGDGATVSAIFQAHTFEDRVLKIDHVTIGAGATLSDATVPLYGAAIGAGTWVGPHSVIMKQEHLLADHRYEGAPTRVCGESRSR
jgi:non-ribosomal peptide synthetase-like protein